VPRHTVRHPLWPSRVSCCPRPGRSHVLPAPASRPEPGPDLEAREAVRVAWALTRSPRSPADARPSAPIVARRSWRCRHQRRAGRNWTSPAPSRAPEVLGSSSRSGARRVNTPRNSNFCHGCARTACRTKHFPLGRPGAGAGEGTGAGSGEGSGASKRFAVSGVHATARGTRGRVLADSDAVHGAGRLVRSL
jgi:hypothetical protein